MKIELGQVKVSFFPADMIALKSASQKCSGTPGRSLSLFQGVHEVKAIFIIIL